MRSRCHPCFRRQKGAEREACNVSGTCSQIALVSWGHSRMTLRCPALGHIQEAPPAVRIGMGLLGDGPGLELPTAVSCKAHLAAAEKWKPKQKSKHLIC